MTSAAPYVRDAIHAMPEFPGAGDDVQKKASGVAGNATESTIAVVPVGACE